MAVNTDKILRQLSELVIWSRIDKLSLGALRKAYGVEAVQSLLMHGLPETRTQLAVAGGEGQLFLAFVRSTVAHGRLLRLANGHAIPKNLGMEAERALIHEELGIDPKNTNWEEYDS